MDRKEQLQALNLLVILLNEVHRDSLKLLLKFLGQVVANEPHNKMSLNNVAMITAPNLFISGRKSKVCKPFYFGHPKRCSGLQAVSITLNYVVM